MPPARRDANVRAAKETFDGCPLADVVAFDPVADELQYVPQHERGQAYPAGQDEQQNKAPHGQGDSDEVHAEVERVAVALPPVAQDAAEGSAERRLR